MILLIEYSENLAYIEQLTYILFNKINERENKMLFYSRIKHLR